MVYVHAVGAQVVGDSEGPPHSPFESLRRREAEIHVRQPLHAFGALMVLEAWRVQQQPVAWILRSNPFDHQPRIVPQSRIVEYRPFGVISDLHVSQCSYPLDIAVGGHGFVKTKLRKFHGF